VRLELEPEEATAASFDKKEALLVDGATGAGAGE
jgi:hypothetical protein